jgi:hypothetical protein
MTRTTPRSWTLVSAAPLAGALVALTAAAAPSRPDVSRITISAEPDLIGVGSQSGIGGQLVGGRTAGRPLALEADEVPFGVYETVATTTSGSTGQYEFRIRPERNTRYRVSLRSSGAVRSAEQIVYVRQRVTMRVDDPLPSRGQRVRFFGSVLPAHDGLLAHIQRRTPSGAYRNVARLPLLDAGAARSRFEAAIPVTRSGVYRILVPSSDENTKGVSAPRVLRISG